MSAATVGDMQGAVQTARQTRYWVSSDLRMRQAARGDTSRVGTIGTKFMDPAPTDTEQAPPAQTALPKPRNKTPMRPQNKPLCWASHRMTSE